MKLTVAMIAAVVMIGPSSLSAQPLDEKPVSDKGIQLGEAKTMRYRVGMTVQAQQGNCGGLLGTFQIPTEWPEQSLKLVNEEVSTHVRGMRQRKLDGGLLQATLQIPRLPSGEMASAVLTYDITKHAVLPPPDTSIFVLPQKLSRDHRKLFLAASPLIEVRHSKIRAAARELEDEHGDKPAWQFVEAIYDWVRENVEYRDGVQLQGAVDTLKVGWGSHESMTNVFIALCRANKIPARTVWVPDYCYPEFYLEDDEGNGHWFPCEIARTRAFGAMPDQRPILQKGENVDVPEKKEPQRFVGEFLKGKSGRGLGRPTVIFIRQILAAE